MVSSIEGLIINLTLGLIVFLIALVALLRMVRKLGRPHRKVVKTLLVLALFLFLAAWIIQFFNYNFQARFLSYTASMVGVVGITIALWEEFRRGVYEGK